MCLRCCGCTLPGFARWRYFVDMWVAEGHTARWPWLCVLFVHRLAVLLQTGVGHVHTVSMSGPWYTAVVNGGVTLLGTIVPASLCVSIAVVGPTLVTPDGRGGLGGVRGPILWHSFVGLCRCGDGPLRPEVRYIMATPH